jgi:hypothetical protein
VPHEPENHAATLNRSAIVVTPKQPFLDWLHATDPTSVELTLVKLTLDPTIYLIPECDTDDDVVEVLRDSFEEIFAEQLAGWCTDESVWPRDRGFDVFRRWFDYQYHSLLIDLSDEPLIRESD